MRVFRQEHLQLLTFLARKQAWLSPPEIARTFRLRGRPVSKMTLYRWFATLEEQTGFAYFPHPRMNRLGLAEVYVRIEGPRNPGVLSTVPFSHAFFLELGWDGRSSVIQEYWVPGPDIKAFGEYWKTATELGLVQSAEVVRARNTHFVFSPFQEVIREDGWVEFPAEIDNEYFRGLLRRHLREPYEVRLADRVAASPFVIPVVLEHLWQHCSSRQVWQAIRAKGEDRLRSFVRGLPTKDRDTPGAVLAVLQKQWQGLLARFEDIFLQPVVFFPPGLLRNCPILSVTVQPGSEDRIVNLAMEASRRSVTTALMPEINGEGRCRIWCNPPSDQLPAMLRLINEFHRGTKNPRFGVIDLGATRRLAQPAFVGFDWGAFDPEDLTWRFEGEAYLEGLKGLAPSRPLGFSPGVP